MTRSKWYHLTLSVLLSVVTLLVLPACGTVNAESRDVVRERGPWRAQRKHVKKKTIVVDAGHGGNDFGTHSLTKPYYHEKYLALATALMVKDHLQKMGYRVVLTRSKDKFISLDKRVQIANERDANVFVSVHYNSAPNRKAHGIEIYYYTSKEQRKRTAESHKLAQNALAHVIKASRARDRGAKEGNFAVIRNTKMPAILVEGGFMTNSGEMSRLKDPKYLNKIAWGIAKGVDQFVR